MNCFYKKMVFILTAFLIFLSFTLILNAERVYTDKKNHLSLNAFKTIKLPDLLKPNTILVKNDNLYITEGTSILIYSTETFKLKRKIGCKGEGPKEFKPYLFLDKGISVSYRNDRLVIGSERKISIFSCDGDFVKEYRLQSPNAFNWIPFELGYLALIPQSRKEGPFFSYGLFDDHGRQIKELCSKPVPHYKEGRNILWQLLPYEAATTIATMGNKVFIASTGNQLIIDCYDSSGNSLFTIKKTSNKRPITTNDREQIYDVWQETPYIKKNWASLRKMIIVPEYFPAIRSFCTSAEKLFVQTYQVENGKSEFFVFDGDGTLLERLLLPVVDRNIIQSYPYSIHKNHIYQLVENQQQEEWELHISSIMKHSFSNKK